MVLVIDRETLVDWGGFAHAGDGHVLGVRDIVRRPDGHDVVVRLPIERLDRLIARRHLAGDALADGEIVTLAVSVVRGLDALHVSDEGLGQWWLLDGGRPALVLGAGEETPLRASSRLLTDAAAHAPDSEVATILRRFVADVLDRPRRGTALQGVEAELFAVAQSAPLRASAAASAVPVRAPRESQEHVDDVRAGSWAGGFVFHLDARLAARISDAWTAWRRRFRSSGTSSRRGVLVCGALVAAVVLGVGVLWPSDDSGGASAGIEPSGNPSAAIAPSPATSADADPAGEETPTSDATVTGSGADASVEVLASLLDARDACAGEGCRAALWEDPSRDVTGGAIDADRADRRITLLDAFGDLAVLRVEHVDGATAPQLVTIVRMEQQWRVRDVYDAADPPSGS